MSQTSQVLAFGQSGANYIGQQGLTDADGNHVMAGKKFQTNDYPHLAFFNANKVFQWAYRFDKPSVTAMKVLQTRDKNYVAAFATGASSLLIKFDALGNILWYRDFSNVHSFEDMCEDGNNNLYLVGNNMDKMLLTRIGSNGAVVWTHAYRVVPASNYLFGKSIVETQDQQLLLCGVASYLNGTPAKVVALKTDKAGNVVWSSVISSPGYTLLVDKLIESTKDGKLFGVGYRSNGGTPSFDGFSLLLDSVGMPLKGRWVGFDFQDNYYDVAEAPEGGYVAVGMSKPVLNCGGNMYYTRFSASNDTIFNKTYGTAAGNGAFFFNISAMPGGGYSSYGSGSLWSSIQQPYDYTHLLADAQCELPCKKFGQVFHSDTVALLRDTVIEKLSFTANHSSTFQRFAENMMVVDACTGQVLDVEEEELRSQLSVFPNPFADIIRIQGIQGKVWAEVYNVTGVQLKREELQNEILDLRTLSEGVYFLVLTEQDGSRVVKRLVKK